MKNFIETVIESLKGNPSGLLDYINLASDWVWGYPLIILLLGTGLYLSFLLKGIQFRGLIEALKLSFSKSSAKGEGDISHYQALMTALAATVGTGNIAGVATAIVAGGPGALFWMWMTGVLGMATKFAEAVLAVRFREKDEKGEMSGGPMYYIQNGLKLPFLAKTFAFLGAIAAFGTGNMVQSNSIAQAVEQNFSISPLYTGILITITTFLVIIGGIKSIGKVTAKLVPTMILIYIFGALVMIFLHLDSVIPAFKMILIGAFKPKAVAGGALGATLMYTVRMGVARGIFSNESGMGSSPIAAAAAKTEHPVSQALVSMTQTFIDTIIVCTLTGLVIIISNSWVETSLDGAVLTSDAFSRGLAPIAFGTNLGGVLVTIGLVLFAYSTIIGWCYYGEKCVQFFFHSKAILPYRYIFVAFVMIGSVAKLEFVWKISDIMNGLMTVPNLIGLLGLSFVVKKLTFEYNNKTNTNL